MTFLLDTNVLSETRKARRNAGVSEWISDTPEHRLCLSAITVGEVARGISRLRARGEDRQARVLDSWLEDVIDAFADRIAPVTVEVAKEWGAQSAHQPVPVPDALIAATAKVHGWTLVTRNVKDFEHTGVRVLNPFTE